MILAPGKCASDEVFATNEIQGCSVAMFLTIVAVESEEWSSTTTTFVGRRV